jgi:hypothetical protein
MIPQELIGKSDNTRQAVETIGFELGEPFSAAAALKASGRGFPLASSPEICKSIVASGSE